MERLSPLDASFLYLEGPRTPMHISSLSVYEGPIPSEEDLRAMLDRRLPLVPRFRQRLATVPWGAHRPVWIDDESFDLDAHVSHVALPEPTEASLSHLTARLLSQPLCRTRPLWEMWLIDGLPDERFAILAKTHHCLWDGIAGIDLHAVLLDESPRPDTDERVARYEPRPEPNALGLVARAVADRTREAVDNARSLADAARHPGRTWRKAAGFARDAGTLASSFIRPAPVSPLNGRTGSRRRFSLARGSLQAVKDLRSTTDASVNDVVLASVACAVREWQRHRRLATHDVRAMVPVSVRRENGLGNQVSMLVVDLPVSERAPLSCLDVVHQRMEQAKASGQVAGGEAITRMSGWMPPTAIAAMTTVQSMMRPFNLLVTNIPGPQRPLYLLGRRLVELFPQAPLAAGQALSIAALSYENKLGFGLLADHDRLPDVDVLARSLEDSLEELTRFASFDTMVPAGSGALQAAVLAGVP